MKTVETGGITAVVPVPGGTDAWYYGISYEHGDLYEAEEIFRAGGTVTGRTLCLLRYPEGETFFPLPKREGTYPGEPVYFEDGIWFVNVDFPRGVIEIRRFDCRSFTTGISAEIPLASVKNCYNLSLQTAPLTLTRQCVGENEFEIVWPERASFRMGDHDSFFLRNGDDLYFSRWHETGEGPEYRWWTETIVRDTEGNEREALPGDLMRMPNGEIWFFPEKTEEKERKETI